MIRPDRRIVLAGGAALTATACATGLDAGQARPHARRLVDRAIITAESDPSIGENIQGPSLIRVPAWVRNPLGRYYLYFADHKGSYIRLAYANSLKGPWRVHVPGALHISDTPFPKAPPPASPEQTAAYRETVRGWGQDPDLHPQLIRDINQPHIASPDVIVDEANQRLILYYHGLEDVGRQVTRVATSTDGLSFQSRPDILGLTYWRSFRHGGLVYGLAMPGQVYRSKDPLGGYQTGPLLFNRNMRHSAVLVRGDTLFVAWTQVGDAPERIYLTRIDISGPWESWALGETTELLRPERPWEGADQPLVPSVRSVAFGKVNQLRDPAFFEEDGRIFMPYAIAGESGIAIAEVFV
jgi:hypothetical protein